MLIGKVQIEGGCANFCFGRNGEMWCFGEHKLWRVKLSDESRGLCWGFEAREAGRRKREARGGGQE